MTQPPLPFGVAVVLDTAIEDAVYSWMLEHESFFFKDESLILEDFQFDVEAEEEPERCCSCCCNCKAENDDDDECDTCSFASDEYSRIGAWVLSQERTYSMISTDSYGNDDTLGADRPIIRDTARDEEDIHTPAIYSPSHRLREATRYGDRKDALPAEEDVTDAALHMLILEPASAPTDESSIASDDEYTRSSDWESSSDSTRGSDWETASSSLSSRSSWSTILGSPSSLTDEECRQKLFTLPDQSRALADWRATHNGDSFAFSGTLQVLGMYGDSGSLRHPLTPQTLGEYYGHPLQVDNGNPSPELEQPDTPLKNQRPVSASTFQGPSFNGNSVQGSEIDFYGFAGEFGDARHMRSVLQRRDFEGEEHQEAQPHGREQVVGKQDDALSFDEGDDKHFYLPLRSSDSDSIDFDVTVHGGNVHVEKHEYIQPAPRQPAARQLRGSSASNASTKAVFGQNDRRAAVEARRHQHHEHRYQQTLRHLARDRNVDGQQVIHDPTTRLPLRVRAPLGGDLSPEDEGRVRVTL
jgi:hypothetical protein